MIRIGVLLLAMFNATAVFAGCLSDSQLQQLTEKESRYLSQQIPPAFKHALVDKAVKLDVQAAVGEGCHAKLVLTLPQADIDEANAVLDAQPAKKIMLGAQGYALPQEVINTATFTVDPASLEIPNVDILQTAPYGKLRASVELMYSFISQKRSNISEAQTNETPWPEALTTQVVSSCDSATKAVDCTCVAKQYAMRIPARQMEYILSNEENPYAMGAGANQGFKTIKQKASSVCKR